MTLQEFTAGAAARGMIIANGMAYGEIQGFPFAIRGKGEPIRSIVISFKLAQKMPGKVLKSIQKTLKAQGISGCSAFYYNNVQQILGLSCAGRDADIWNRMHAAMSIAVQQLFMAGLTPPQTCPICKQGLCDSLAYVGGAYVPVHKQCCENLSFNTMSAAEANQSSGNMAAGILGAIIGGTIATIPTILTICLLEMIWSWLYALIPLGAYYGYQLFRGKMNKAVLPIVIVIAVFELFVVEWALWYIGVVQYWGEWMTLSECIISYFRWMTVGEIAADLLSPAIFTVLGLFISFGRIRQNNQTKIEDANSILRSLYVKNGAVMPQGQSQPAAQPQNADGFAGTFENKN